MTFNKLMKKPTDALREKQKGHDSLDDDPRYLKDWF